MADLIHGILFLIGSVPLVLGVYLYLSSRRFLATGLKTQATVVENIPVRYSPKNSSNVRIVSFWGIYLGTNILLILGLPMFMIGSGYFLFFQQKPIHLTIDDNWRAWWDSREMYSKQELAYIPIYRTENNRAVFDELLKDIGFGSFEQYDRHAQSWTFVSVFFSENYLEILPMLALLKNLASYQEPTEKGIAMIYDFCWGGTSTMAFLEFYEQKALLKDYTETTQIEPSILEEANQVLSATVEAFNKRFED